MKPTYALSIRQPWAWLIAKGFKDIENRTWSTKVTGRIYIHASLKREHVPHAELVELCRLSGHKMPYAYFTVEGCIIGEVDITGCVTKSDSPWFEGPYGFTLAKPVLYGQPIPYKGKLGFFRVTL